MQSIKARPNTLCAVQNELRRDETVAHDMRLHANMNSHLILLRLPMGPQEKKNRDKSPFSQNEN